MSDELPLEVTEPRPRDVFLALANDDGEILRTVRCSSDKAESQAFGGEQLVETDGEVSPATHYVVAGASVPYTAEQADRKRVRPSSAARWINASMSWDDPTTLADAQLQASNAIDVAAGAARLRYITEAPATT